MTKEMAQIKGFPGYFITRNGEVYSELSGRLRKLKQSPLSTGYMRVNLKREGKQNHKTIHRLLLETFVGPPPTPKHETRHLNGVRADNRLENLAWGTNRDNHEDRRRHGTLPIGEKCRASRLTEKQVLEILERIHRHETFRPIAQTYNVSISTIWFIALGKTWRHLTRKPYKNPRANGNPKLTGNQVNQILRKLKCGKTQRAIAREYGVSVTAINYIALGKTWRHISRKALDGPNLPEDA